MISGSAMIECGSGSVASTYAVNTVTGAGLVAMRSCLPQPIGTRDLEPGEFDSITSNAEVLGETRTASEGCCEEEKDCERWTVASGL